MDNTREFDVLIIGAGLSGIGAAYHLQTKCPAVRYAILEARSSMGGTWDLFRYPGVRSDSDMYTLGYSFAPWKEAKAIADGSSILRYIHDTAKTFGIESHIQFNRKLEGASWSSTEQKWTVTGVKTDSKETFSMRASFLILCCGYYDYEEGYTPEYPGRSRFKGPFIHPQHWNPNIDYANKEILVIGSGATSITLVPELAKKAKKVVMLQRSPSYIASLPSVDSVAEWIKNTFPQKMAHWIVRWKNILVSWLFFRFCRYFPHIARRFLISQMLKSTKNQTDKLKHFTPQYSPWDQRLCFVPDGDFFHTLNEGKAEIITDKIKTFTEKGVQLESGKELNTDMIITATGLKLKFLGGMALVVDGKRIEPGNTIPYKGAMLSGVPNLGMAFGYTNASWTLKCDLTTEWFARILQFMQKNKYSVVMPEEHPTVEKVPLIDFSSGYFQRAKGLLPDQGTKAPWKVNQNYFADLVDFRMQKLNDEGLRFS